MQARRKPSWTALVAVLIVIPLGGPVTAGEFLSTIEDLPLMPGLAEAHGAGLAFDKPGGRIVEAYAEGVVDRDTVLRFYAETLPGLGWRAQTPPLAAARWRRDGEELHVNIVGDGPPLVVRFYLAPNSWSDPDAGYPSVR